MNKPYWQPYWWRLLFRADGEPGWSPMGPGPLGRVPNGALKGASLEEWARTWLEDAARELDDLRGELLLECYGVPAPGTGTRPVCSHRVQLGPGR